MEMIEGLHFDISSEELKDHFLESAESYANQVRRFENLVNQYDRKQYDKEPDDVIYGNHNTPEDPRNLWEHTISLASRNAKMFSFLASHAIKNHTYRLTKRELAELELI